MLFDGEQSNGSMGIGVSFLVSGQSGNLARNSFSLLLKISCESLQSLIFLGRELNSLGVGSLDHMLFFTIIGHLVLL